MRLGGPLPGSFCYPVLVSVVDLSPPGVFTPSGCITSTISWLMAHWTSLRLLL